MAVKSLEEEIGDNYELGYECGLDRSFPILIIKYRQKITLPKNNWIGQQLAEFFKYSGGGYVNFDGFFSYTLFDGTEVFCFVYDYIYP